MEPRPTDADLVARWRRDDDDAFATIVRRYRPLLWNIAYRLLHDGEDAQDALQDAFTAAHVRRHTLRSPDELKAWLVSITTNKSRDILRKRAVYPPTRHSWEADFFGVELEQALGKLGEEERIVLTLVDIAGYPRRVPAEILDISENTVSKRLATARLRVARELGYVANDRPTGRGSGQ